MFITIRSYTSSKKADYISCRLERAGIECKVEPREVDEQEQFSVQVQDRMVEEAVSEILKVYSEYPKEDFELRTDPRDLLRILIPIDFSEKSFEACKYALDIAAKRPVEIKLLHVWNDELNDSVAVRSSYMMEDFKRMQRNELKREINTKLDAFSSKLNALIAKSTAKQNLLFHFTIAEGIVYKQVKLAVSRYQPQLVILAHNDNKDFQFRISREVANAVIDLAVCPVYYIPQKVYYKPLGELHIMYATNFDKNDIQSFKVLQELTSGYVANLHLLHIISDSDEAKTEEKMNFLLKQIEETKTTDVKIHTEIITNNILIKGFDKYIQEKQIDMMSFTSLEYGVWHKLFNPDNLKSIMSGSTIPLLIFRYKSVEG